MIGGRPLLVCAVTSLGLLAGAPPDAAAQALSLRASAGLDGSARAGRWLPVVVTIENNGVPVSGTLTASTGDDSAARELQLGTPARERVELYLRAPDRPDASVQVRFDPAGVAAAVPLRIVAADDAFALCVAAAGLLPDANCSATVDAASVPSNWQGLDAADVIAWTANGRERLTAAQQRAVARFEAVRAWNSSTSMAPSPHEIPASADDAGRTVLPAAIALALMALAFVPRAPAAAWRVYMAIVVIVTAGSVLTLADGRFGSAAAVSLRESFVIRAGVSTPESAIAVRGVATFPFAGTFDVRPAVDSPHLVAAAGSRQLGVLVTADGNPRVPVDVAKRGAVQYEVSGFLSQPAVQLLQDGAATTLTNRTNADLRNCTGAAGVTLDRDSVAAGGTLKAAVSPGTFDPALTCEMDAYPPALDAISARIRHRSVGLLVVDLRTPEGIR